MLSQSHQCECQESKHHQQAQKKLLFMLLVDKGNIAYGQQLHPLQHRLEERSLLGKQQINVVDRSKRDEHGAY